MNHLNPHKTGIAFGSITGGLHLLWTVFVALGWAQGLMNFSAWAHMVEPPLTFKPFDPTAAVTVIVVAAVIGYVVGTIFARVFNRAHK